LAYICQKFTIPDFLATGPKTVAEIATHMQTRDVQRVERLMYALASEGMTQLDKNSPDPKSPRFVNSALSATLRSDHPNSMRGTVGHNMDDLYNVWGALPLMFGPDAIESAWDVGWPNYPHEKGGLWNLYEADNVREEQFGRAMMSLEGLGGLAMATDGPFHKFNRFIDVGGSHGHFLYKVLSANADKEGILFDRPHVLSNAKKLWNESGGRYNDGPHKRLSIVEGNFFEEESIPDAKDGDVYYMRYILHDWGTEDCLKILKNIKKKMGSKKATLLIGECAVPDRDRVGVPASMYHIDIQMMAAFGDDAKERTPTMWKELFALAGFEFVAIHPTRSIVHWVEAVPLP
jgi:hypothetical protein